VRATRISQAVTIRANPAAVWQVVSDFAAQPAWMRDAVDVRFVSGRTTGVGTVLDCDTRIGPLRLTDRLVVTDWEEGRSIGIRHDGPVGGAGRFTIAPAGAGTRFTWTEELRFPRWLGGPAAGALARPVLAAVWQRDLAALRARVEGSDVAAASPGTDRRRRAGRAADSLLEASIAGSFARTGIATRSRLLPEFAEDARPSLAGRVVIVTGATSGIGLAIATELARRHATVNIVGRDGRRVASARQQIIAATGNESVGSGTADLTDLDSIRRFAARFAAGHDRLHVLVHNAGAMYHRYQANAAGTELTFAGQVLGPFALTKLLLPQLLRAAPSRVIVMSSGGMYGQPLARSVRPMGPGDYRGVTAYARAKRAQVALSAEWARRIPAEDVAFHAMHPGWADTPGMATSLPAFHRLLRPILRTPEEGADTAIWLASAGPNQLGSGKFWHDRRPRRMRLFGGPAGPDAQLAGQLWDQLDAQVSAARG